LIDGKEIEALGAAILTMTAFMIVTACIVAGLALAHKRTKSLIIRADLLHYKSDLWTNIGVIVSLGLIALSGLHFIDGAVSIAIALFIAVGAYKIVQECVLTLMDRAIEEPLLSQICEIVQNAPRILRTRKSAKTYVVEAHLVFDETISLKDAHDTSDYVESAIAALDKNAKWLITVHLDPYDDSKNES
jgi:cation diffusion facilitator family transporter